MPHFGRILSLLTAATFFLTPAAALSSAAPLAQMVDDFPCMEVDQIPTAECQALVDLYESTGGDEWVERRGWLTTFTPCTTPWRGVTCAAGHVVGVELVDNELTGALPASLADLTQLATLRLAHNMVRGPLPDALGDLAQLQTLDLTDNQFSGAIPPSLGNLANLQALLLWSNQLSGAIPASLGNLPAVQRLVLTGNALTGPIPPQLGNLAALQELGLADNQLSGAIPPALGNLANLRRLALARNELSGSVPTALTQLANLEELWLDTNQLDGAVPRELGGLARLRLLSLSRNRLDGPIPAELGGLASLQELWLDSNMLSGPIPDAFCNLTRLFFLDVGFNKISAAPACASGLDPFWQETQTVPPTGLQAAITAASTATSTVSLSWAPVRYTFDAGYYEISYAAAGRPYAVLGVTKDKTVSRFVVEDLPAGHYRFRVRTFTAAHDTAPAFQANDLWSDYTPPVSVVVGDPPPVVWTLHFPRIEVQATRE
jgi:hypothetical protein